LTPSKAKSSREEKCKQSQRKYRLTGISLAVASNSFFGSFAAFRVYALFLFSSARSEEPNAEQETTRRPHDVTWPSISLSEYKKKNYNRTFIF